MATTGDGAGGQLELAYSNILANKYAVAAATNRRLSTVNRKEDSFEPKIKGGGPGG